MQVFFAALQQFRTKILKSSVIGAGHTLDMEAFAGNGPPHWQNQAHE